jgi:hypothetical protein
MACKNRAYTKDEEEFNSSPYVGYFRMLSGYFQNQMKFSDKQIKQYISVCAKLHETSFDPWQLHSHEYLEKFKEWYRVNKNSDAYINNVKHSINEVIKFCKAKKIKNLTDYINSWGVMHYTSGKLNDNVAFMLGLHEVQMTKPEKFMVKTYLKNVQLIKERVEREGRLKEALESGIQQAKEMLIWI